METSGRLHVLEIEDGRFRAALDAVPVPVFLVTAEGSVAFANRAFARWMGQPPRALRGRPIELLVGAQAGEWVRTTLARPVQSSAASVGLSIPGVDGRLRRVEVTVDTHGTVGEMPAHATVSLIEQPEAVVSGSVATDLQAMVDAVAPAVALVDSDWELLRWNRSFAASGVVPRDRVSQGLDLAATISRLMVHRLGPRSTGDATLPDVAAAPGGRLEFQAQFATGKRYQVELTAQPDGRIVIMLLDVTDSSRVTEELRRSERMRTIGQLTGGVAHDFNNLLSVVVGNLDLLEEQGLFGEQRSLVQAAKRSALRGASLTGSLLTYQRRAAGQPEPTSATAMVENLERVLRRTLGGHVLVETNLTTEPWLALVDPGLLENAIVNLAINARDAMPSGGTLTIATENVAGGMPQIDGSPALDAVVLSVKDTGVGMSEEIRIRAMEAFFTTKTEGRGTGLGLAMVRRFVRAAQGRIDIRSEEGVGTEVRMVFARHAGPSAEGGPKDSRPTIQGRGKHVLLVEDDSRVRDTFRGLLHRLGYQVTDVARPQAALELIASDGDAYDVLLIDARFPQGPSGVEVARRLSSTHPSLQTALMSGHPETERPFGIPVLSKPCTLSALASVLVTLDD